MAETHVADFVTPPVFWPFVLSYGDRDAGLPVATTVLLHADGRASIDWRRIEAMAARWPLPQEPGVDDPSDFMWQVVLAHTLLAVRDGRVDGSPCA